MANVPQEVRDWLLSASLDDIRLLQDIITTRFTRLRQQVGNAFNPGDKVTWTKGKRRPVRYKGEVVSADHKYIYVRSDDFTPSPTMRWNWKCSPLSLQKIT